MSHDADLKAVRSATPDQVRVVKASHWCDRARSPIPDLRGAENRTALISLGIPKLVRFAKIRPQQYTPLTYTVLSYLTRLPSALQHKFLQLTRAGVVVGDGADGLPVRLAGEARRAQ
jgi:hypothetical protein